MLVTIGLLILAVLLFGSSVVLGAIGVILGFIALAAGLTLGSVILDVHPAWIVLGLLAMIAIGRTWAVRYERVHGLQKDQEALEQLRRRTRDKK